MIKKDELSMVGFINTDTTVYIRHSSPNNPVGAGFMSQEHNNFISTTCDSVELSNGNGVYLQTGIVICPTKAIF